MNNQRTFGIEIECHSQISKGMMVARLKRFFDDNGINHSAIADSYGHQTDEYNTTLWYVKDDGSLYAQNSVMRTQFPKNMEIASPVLKGREGLKALKIVCDALDGIATVSKSCGLHVHHGVQGISDVELRRVINGWLKCEKYFYFALPNSRQSNNYCKSWKDCNARQIQNHESPMSWYNEMTTGLIDRRKTALNLRSYTSRRTLEFRLHSGTVEFPKMKNWLLLTQRWLEFAIAGLFDSTYLITFQGFISKLKEEGSIEIATEIPTPQLNPYAGKSEAEIYIRPGSKKKKWPRAESKAYTILEEIKTGATKKQLVDTINAIYGLIDHIDAVDCPAQKKYVSAMLTNMKSEKAGWGFNVKKKGRGKAAKFYLLPLDYEGDPEECPTVNPDAPLATSTSVMHVNVGNLTNDDNAAIGHFVERCVHFEEEQRGNDLD